MSDTKEYLITAMMLGGMLGADGSNSDEVDKMSPDALKREYNLIQQKRSRLSARLRNKVVYHVEKGGRDDSRR